MRMMHRARNRVKTREAKPLFSGLTKFHNMTINPDTLSSLASEYAQSMTSIRGRRVQRLLKREFAGADEVAIVKAAGAVPTVVFGLSATGAALCATDGTGKHASVIKWRHGSRRALETRFDLWKDSLPVLGSNSRPLAELLARSGIRDSKEHL